MKFVLRSSFDFVSVFRESEATQPREKTIRKLSSAKCDRSFLARLSSRLNADEQTLFFHALCEMTGIG